MRVLVACEFSGIVRDAFAERGHYAVSCDYLPTEREPKRPHLARHYRGDVFDAFRDCGMPRYGTGIDLLPDFDLMIAHPPCTYLANSGVRWLYGGKGKRKDKHRWAQMEEAAQFFKRLLDLPIPRIAIENPIMHRYGVEIVGRKHDQLIQPWQFGHGETKATCLWLKNLPPLQPTNIVEGREPRVHHASPGPERWKERARTFPGIAKAMAEQWGAL